MVAKTFQKDHPRAGEPTGFAQKIMSGEKIHTLRGNYDRWKMIVDEVNAGRAILSVRQWTDKPYKSKHEYITDFRELGLEKVGLNSRQQSVHVMNEYMYAPFEIAKNDGLTTKDFWSWFKESQADMPLIHFTPFRYCEDPDIIQQPNGTVDAIARDLEDAISDSPVRSWDLIKGH